MTFEPFPNEQANDDVFEQVVAALCRRSGMYGVSTFESACAYLNGYNAACSGGPLIGITQWLIVRAGEGNTLAWNGLVQLEIAERFKQVQEPSPEQMIQALGQILAEFFEYRRTNGITKIFHEYAKWLLRKSWYTGPLRESR